MSTASAILIANEFHPATVHTLQQRFDCHLLYQQAAADRADFLQSVGAQCRVVASASWDCDPLVYGLPNLELISCFGVGVDGIDFQQTARQGIRVTNTPDVLTDAVADLALGLLLCLSRDLSGAERFLRAGSWLRGAYPFGQGIQGKTLGIAGFGRIGAAIASRAERFGMAIAYHSRSPRPVDYRYCSSLAELAKDCDVLMNVLPGGAETHQLIGADILSQLGSDGLLINVGRGSTVDEDALVAALQQGIIAGAALDVFADEPRVRPELIALPNVVLTPHIGSATVQTRQAMGDLLISNIEAYLAGQPLLTEVAQT